MAEGSGYDAGKIESTLDVDRTPFQQGLDAAKREARDFADGKYEASLGAETRSGEASLAAFKARLDEIAREHPTVTVDVDTGKADAELAVMDAEVRKVQRDARDAAGAGGLGGLVAAGIALGPALIPVLAAAGAGTLALGGALTAAVAGGVAFGVVAKGAFSDIEKQQKAITAAEKQYTSAVTDKARAQALEKEKAAWDALTPSEQAASQALEGLEDRFHATEKALQPIVLTAITPWLNTASTAVGFLTPLVTSAAGAIGTLGQQAQTALGSPYWQNFSRWLSAQANPALTIFGQTLGNTATGFAGLGMASTPVITQLEGGMRHLSEEFAAFGKAAGTSSGFQHFLDYVEINGPRVVHTIGDLGQAAGSLIGAMSALGPPLLQGVDLFARLVSMQPDLFAFGIELYAWNKIFTSIAGTASAAARSLGLFAAAEEATAAKTAATTVATERSAAATATAGRSAGGAVAGFNPLTAAVAALAVTVTYTWGQWQKYADTTDAALNTAGQQASVKDMNAALEAQKDTLDKNVHSWHNMFLGIVPMLALLGKAKSETDRLDDAQQNIPDNLAAMNYWFGVSGTGALNLAHAVGVNLTGSTLDMISATEAYLNANGDLLRQNPRLAGSILNVDAAFRQTSGGVGAYSAAIAATLGVQEGAFIATSHYRQQLSNLNTQLSKNKHSLDINTAAGRENVDIVDQAVQLAEAQAAKVADVAYQNSKAVTPQGRNNDAVNAGNRALATNIQRLVGQMRQAGYSKAEINRLLTQMGLLSKTNAVGTVGLRGYDTANAELNTILNKLDYLNSREWYATVVYNVVPPGTIPKSYMPSTTGTAPGPFGGLLDPGIPGPIDTSGRSGSGPRAAGGPTIAGSTYLVGEHGPEFWTAGANGFVTPNEMVPTSLGGRVVGGDSGDLVAVMNQQLAATREQNALLRAQLAALYAVPAGTADALNGVSRSSAHLARGTVPVY